MELIDLQQILENELSKPLESIDAKTVTELSQITEGLTLPADLEAKRVFFSPVGGGLDQQPPPEAFRGDFYTLDFSVCGERVLS